MPNKIKSLAFIIEPFSIAAILLAEIFTFAGVLIIAVLNNGLNILGVSTYYQEVIKAIVILIAVLSDRKR